MIIHGLKEIMITTNKAKDFQTKIVLSYLSKNADDHKKI